MTPPTPTPTPTPPPLSPSTPPAMTTRTSRVGHVHGLRLETGCWRRRGWRLINFVCCVSDARICSSLEPFGESERSERQGEPDSRRRQLAERVVNIRDEQMIDWLAPSEYSAILQPGPWRTWHVTSLCNWLALGIFSAMVYPPFCPKNPGRTSFCATTAVRSPFSANAAAAAFPHQRPSVPCCAFPATRAKKMVLYLMHHIHFD
jgi:hypothetical protein